MTCSKFARYTVKFLDDNQLITICRDHLPVYLNIDGYKIYVIPDNIEHLGCDHEVSNG